MYYLANKNSTFNLHDQVDYFHKVTLTKLIIFKPNLFIYLYYFQEQNKYIWIFSFRLIYHNKTRNLSTIVINAHNSIKTYLFPVHAQNTTHFSKACFKFS